MVRLKAYKSSKWLANLFNSINRQLEGKILAIFDHSFVAKFNGPGLVHFTTMESNLSPFSFAIEDFKPEYLYEGANLIYSNGTFIVNNITISVDIDISTYNESDIKAIDQVKLIEVPDIKVSKFYSEKFKNIRSEIISESSKNNSSNIINLLLSLVGLGEGLTPSGDDYITGYLYGLYNANNIELINQIKARLLENVSESTTLISEIFLRHAIKGRFSQNIVEHNWEELLNYGHTSGYFTYLGILDSIQAKKLNFQR